MLPLSIKLDYLLNFGEIPFRKVTLLAMYDHRADMRSSEIKTLGARTLGVGEPKTVDIFDNISNGVQKDMDLRRTQIRDQDVLHDLDTLVDRLTKDLEQKAISSPKWVLHKAWSKLIKIQNSLCLALELKMTEMMGK